MVGVGGWGLGFECIPGGGLLGLCNPPTRGWAGVGTDGRLTLVVLQIFVVYELFGNIIFVSHNVTVSSFLLPVT